MMGSDIAEFNALAKEYPAPPEQTLAYERYMAGSAIRSIQALMAKLPSKAQSREYYEMMEQCFIAIEQVMHRLDEMDTRLMQLYPAVPA